MSPSSGAPLAASIYARSHLTGSFRLRSGALSSEYFDKYQFESDPVLLRAVAAELVALLPPGAEMVAGPELGGIPLATMVSHLSDLPAVFVRKEAKKYGTCRLAEGGDVSGNSVVVVEDVVTSGGQLVESCMALRELGAHIEVVLCVIDRESAGRESLAAAGIELRSLFTMEALQGVTGPEMGTGERYQS